MKKIFLTITLFMVALLGMAQAPNLLNYQGVARNAVGNVIPNQQIGLRLSILTGTSTGPVVYSETRTVLTNAFGLFNVKMGDPLGIIAQTGTIAGVNWSGLPSGAAAKYLQVEIDPNGGSSFTNVGSTQMLSVPYALSAAGAPPTGAAGGDLTGTYPNPQILFPLVKTFSFPGSQLIGMTNSSTTGVLGALTGTSASNDGNAYAITGTMSSSSPGSFSTGLRGINNGTGGLGIGVWGSQAGSGYGVYGTAPAGWAVIGETTSGYGVWGNAFGTGIGVYGTSGSSNAAWFPNTNASNTANTVNITTNGIGNGISAINTGTGRGAFFQVNNATSTANALEVTTNGTGPSWGIRANSSGTNGAGIFVQSNPANTSNNVFSAQTGLGRAGLFQVNNTASTTDALLATTNSNNAGSTALHGINGSSTLTPSAKVGSWGESDNGWGVGGTSNTGVGVIGATVSGPAALVGQSLGNGAGILTTSTNGRAADFSLPAGNTANVVNASTAGTGIAGYFENTNAASTNYTARVENANITNTAITNASLRVGRGALLANTFALGNTTASVWGVNSNANGVGVQGSTSNGIGVAGVTFQGAGLVGVAADAVNGFGIVTIGRRQFQGPDAAVGKILGATTVNGDALWQTAAALGIVSGSGTLNYIPKWTPNGTTIGNSQLFDDGTYVGLGTATPAPVKFHVVDATANNYRILAEANNSFIGANSINNSFSGYRIQNQGVEKAQFFFNPLNNNVVLNSNGFSLDPAITISNTNEYIGINTHTPGARMEIKDVSVVGTPQLLLNQGNDDFARLSFKNANGASYWTLAGYNNAVNGSERMNFYNSTSGNLMSIAGTGSVGIGTTNQSATYRFSVNNTTPAVAAGMHATNTGTGEGAFNGFYVGQNGFVADLGALVYNWQNSDLIFGTNGTARATIKNTGEFDFYNALRPLGNAGNNNDILVSGGAGVAPSWKSVPSTLSPFVWNTLGNSGTVDGTNFIGTTDNIPFNIRVNNINSGRIGQFNRNTSFGYSALLNPSGTDNSAFGQSALQSNNGGIQNTASGSGSLFSNTTGSTNTAIGYWSMFSNTIGTNNAAVGNLAQLNNTTGSQNSAVGSFAAALNTSGNVNSAIGYASGYSNQTGSQNISNGGYSLFNNTGSNNTGIGYSALATNTTGTGNTALGNGADVTVNNLTNATAIGAGALVSASNSLVLGNGAYVGIGTSSPANKLEVINGDNTRAGNFVNTNAGNNVGAVRAFNSSSNIGAYGVNGISVIASTFGASAGAGIYANSFNNTGLLAASDNNVAINGNSNFSHGVYGATYASAGFAGVYGQGLGNNYGVVGTTVSATFPAGYFTATKALKTLGGVQLTGIGEAAGRILTSDASGNATWQDNIARSVGINIQFFSGANSIPSGVYTPLTNWLTIVNEDNGSNYNPGTGQYTASVTGTYNIESSVIWDPSGAAGPGKFVDIAVFVNGIFVSEVPNNVNVSNFTGTSISISRKLNAGDKVSIYVYQTTGSNMNLQSFYGGQFFTVQYLHK